MTAPAPSDAVLRAGVIRFPPGWHNVLLPVAPRRATALGMTLYTASRPRPLFAQRAMWALARIGGARVVPGPRETWTPPMEADVFTALWRQWAALTGGHVESAAVYERPQSFRQTLVLLVCAGRRSLLVRVRRDGDSLALERRVSAAAESEPPRSFRVPRLAGTGVEQGWHWSAFEAMSTRPHAPGLRLPAEFTDEVSGLVETVLPRPVGVPTHWRGAHGDLSPWNLRRAGGSLHLIDWEDAAWCPPGHDEVYFAATRAALRRAEPAGPLPVPKGHDEARAQWAATIGERVIIEKEEQLQRRLTVLLGAAP